MIIHPTNFILAKDGLLSVESIKNHRLSLVPVNTITNQRSLIIRKNIKFNPSETYGYKFISFSNNQSLMISENLYLNNKLVTDLKVGDDISISDIEYTWSGYKKNNSNNNGESVAKMPRALKRIVDSMKGMSADDFHTDIGVNTAKIISGQTNKLISPKDKIVPSELFEYSSLAVKKFLEGFFRDSNVVEITKPEYLGIQSYIQVVALCVGQIIKTDENSLTKTDEKKLTIKSIETMNDVGYQIDDILNLVCNGFQVVHDMKRKTRGFGS